MKKIIFVALVFLLAIIFYLNGKKLKSTNAGLASTKLKSWSTAKDILNQPIGNLYILKENTEIPKECQSEWKGIFEKPYDDLVQSAETLKQVLSLNCLKNSRYLKNEMMLKNCEVLTQHFGSKADEKKAIAPCLDSFASYRAHVINEMTKGLTDYAHLETKILLNKLVALIENFDPKNLATIEAIAKALAENEPNLYSAQKANLVAQTLKLTTEGADSPHYEANVEEFKETLKHLEHFDSEDPERVAANFLPDILKGDYQKFEHNLEDYVSRNGEDASTYYLRSGIAWKTLRVAEAKSYLDTAIKLSPGNEIYLETKRKIATMNPGESGAYYLNLKFDFTSN